MLPAGVGPPPCDVSGSLGALHEAGCAAWPSLVVDIEELSAWLGERASPPIAQLPADALAADAYLACACLADAPGAVVCFDSAFASLLVRIVQRVDRSPAFVDDARQAIRERLFVSAPGGRPKIAEYAARSPLRAWLRVVALRVALNVHRGSAVEARELQSADDERLAASGAQDPEVRLSKAREKAAVEGAVRDAIKRLSARDRTLLRQHLVDGLSVDGLGAHYHVGRSTAARWLAAAREALRDHTRAELSARLGPGDPASIAAFVRSQLELSARSLLGGPGEPGNGGAGQTAR
jgi:RNA polymerase sigma-70 factor (ECF subfamily)